MRIPIIKQEKLENLKETGKKRTFALWIRKKFVEISWTYNKKEGSENLTLKADAIFAFHINGKH